jgi:hypothetical protein
MSVATPARQRGPATAPEPLSSRRKWKAITLATLLLVPAYWMLLAGLVSATSDDEAKAPDPAAALALGIAVIPFVFIVLAVMTGQRNVGATVLKAMGLCLLLGLPAAAIGGDVVTGIVAGVGAGGIAVIRADLDHSTRTRAAAVAIAVLYTWVLVHTVSVLALLPAPVFPLTAIGLADHWSERRRARDARS